jgi:hypothetical protein
MKTDKRIDEIFRSRLPDVDLPAPPAQDWAAMARSARTGAVLAGKGGPSAMSVRWIRILGGTVAVATACYLAFSPSGPGQEPRSALATAALIPEPSSAVDQPERVSPDARYGSRGRSETLMASPAPTAYPRSELTRVVEQETTRTTARAYTSGNDVQARAHDVVTTGSTPSPKDDTPTPGPGDGSNDVSVEQGVAVSLVIGATGDVIPKAATEHPDGMRAAQGASGSDEEAGDAVNKEEDPMVGMIPLLRPSPAPLPYLPNGPLPIDMDEYLAFPQWSIAPWVSIGHSVYTDPEHGSGTPEGLEQGSGLPVNVGLRVQYAFDPRLAFFTGITVAQKGSLSGTVTSSSTRRTDYHLSGSYLEVPLAMKFIMPLGNKLVYARAGVSLQFNMPNGTSKVTVLDEGVKEMSTLVLAGGSMGTALDLGVGAQFRLGHRLGLFIEPSYQYGLSPVVKHPTFDGLPYNPRIHTFSLATGLSFQLDR